MQELRSKPHSSAEGCFVASSVGVDCEPITLLYGLIRLLMDDVLGQPAENEQQVCINVVDAPAPERVGIPAFIDIGP